MGKFGGLALRGVQMFLYFIAFCCAAIILGFYSYFLSVLADRHDNIPRWEKAVEGMSGAAVLYTMVALILTCFLGGITFFAFLGIVLDVLFAAAFVAIAVLTRDGAHSCRGDNVSTPLGSGPYDQGAGGFDSSNLTYHVKNGTACRFNKACFIVAIIGAFVFLLAAAFQLLLGKHHQREKRFGPSPANGYTHGSAGRRRFWQRKPKYSKDAEAGAFVAGGTGATLAADHHVDHRPSHDTAFTGSTVAAPGAGATTNHHGTYTGSKYDSTVPAVVDPAHPSHHGHHTTTGTTTGTTTTGVTNGSHGYHTHPTGTAVNPYGYDNTTRTAATNY